MASTATSLKGNGTRLGENDEHAAHARKQAKKDRYMQWFYYSHVIPLVGLVFFVDFEMFTKISLMYTTTVSAITAGATYGARGKAESAEAASYDNP